MLSTKKILIIDDEVLIAEHLKSIILSFDCKQIQLASNVKDALQMIDFFKPDLILLDIRLEKKFEGIDFALHLNEVYKIPFIYITAFSDKQTLSRALQTHPAAFITKPFRVPDIYAALSLVFINNPIANNDFIQFKYLKEHIKLATKNISFIERG